MKHRPRVITTWLMTSDYNTIVGDKFAHETKLPYFPCFLHVLWFTAYQSKTSKVQLPVDFTFDEKGDVGLNALKWFEVAKKSARPELLPFFGSMPVFRDDKQLIPLQVADLIAWHIHRKLEIPGTDIERAATERLEELHSTDRQLTKSWLRGLAAEWEEVFEGKPLSFIMRERPGRRKALFDKVKKQVRNRARKMEKQRAEFDNFDEAMLEAEKAAKKKS
jgi:hypothetical protein